MSGDREPVIHEGEASPGFVDEVLDALETLWLGTPSVPAEDRTLFMLAVSEVTTNIVQHSEPGVRVHVRLSADEGQLRAVVRDTAPAVALDLESAELPDAESESGRGLALTLAVLDEFRHDGTEDGNLWTLRRAIGTAPR
ncbi:ATP-binding protein [Arthrobacter woluwensis]|uniref:ATP-binding protein n=1 Tax=Arthrobacter woluwensis TaxID=156980 RepID=UPI0037F71A2B